MSPADSSTAEEDRLRTLPPLPRDQDGPVFREPWEAHAFALAVELSERGHFTWKEWAAALGAELGAAAQRGEPDDGSHYYHHWVAALEKLVTEKGLSDAPTLADRKEAWADAYRHTPHGEPVVLGGGAQRSTGARTLSEQRDRRRSQNPWRSARGPMRASPTRPP